MKYLISFFLIINISYAMPQAYKKCIACHGKKGQGRRAGNIPRLAGQFKGYLAKQILDIKSGRRKVPQMRAFVKRLSKKDIQEITSYLETVNCK